MDRRAHDARREARRTMARYRHLLAGGLAAAAVAFGLEAIEPEASATTPVIVAARDLAGGAAVEAADHATVSVPLELVPAGALDPEEPVTGILAGPVRAGEPLTDVRFVGPDLLQGWGSELVAAPVRVADPAISLLVRPGDRVDILASPTAHAGSTTRVAPDVPVLTVSLATDDGYLAEGALIVVAATHRQAEHLASAAVTSRLSVAIRGRSDPPRP